VVSDQAPSKLRLKTRSESSVKAPIAVKVATLHLLKIPFDKFVIIDYLNEDTAESHANFMDFQPKCMFGNALTDLAERLAMKKTNLGPLLISYMRPDIRFLDASDSKLGVERSLRLPWQRKNQGLIVSTFLSTTHTEKSVRHVR
jgi:hypothetical protein